MESFDHELAALMVADGGTLAVAESCTGGLVAARITEIPGCSAWFMGGVVSYDNRIKEQLLQVPADLLLQEGAVSEGVARRMAEGVRNLMATDYGVAVTGIAGPAGGTIGKPVGTVYIAWVTPEGSAVQRFAFTGGRQDVREETVEKAVSGLKELLKLPKKV